MSVKPPQQIFREACEECHQRKIRCVPRNGPCDNCVSNGRDCVFRQRSAMGRPRKQKSGQHQNSRPRLAASQRLSSSDAQTTQQNTTISRSVGLRQSSQQPPEENDHASNDTSNETDSHVTPSTEPPSYSFTQMATNYPLNLPDVEFDSYFDSTAGNIPSANFLRNDAFDPFPGPRNSDNNNFHSIIPVSSTILFELRRLSDRLFSMDMAEMPTDLSDTIKHVSNFCGLMLPKVSSISLTSQRWEETQTVAQLVVMIISTAMKCYGMLAQRHKDLAACMLQSNSLTSLGMTLDQSSLGEIANMTTLTHTTTSSTMPVNISSDPPNQSTSSHSRVSSSSFSPEGGMVGNIIAWAASSSKIPHCGSVPVAIIPDLTQLKRQLETVMHLTVMDYHTAQFQWILAHLVDALGRLAVAGYQDFPLDELARLQKEAIELRGGIQSLTQEVRESYFA
jgi:Fungal Zn(2)-Cys(6) binuclear cluster domain